MLAWLSAEELQADAIGDLRSSDNKLSLYLIDEADDAETLRVVAALAANRERIANVDFALVDVEHLRSIDVSIEESSGDTADSHVNSLHRDLIKLSATQIFKLANHIYDKQLLKRINQGKVEESIKSSLRAQQLDISRVKLLDATSLLQP